VSSGIKDMKPGDYVKDSGGNLREIASVHGVDPNGRLAKPSEGGFYVKTKDGSTIGMYDARSYHKRNEIR